MKKFMLLIALILIFTVSVVFIYGCGEKKVEEKAEQQVEEVEEAVADTAAVDTTAPPPPPVEE